MTRTTGRDASRLGPTDRARPSVTDKVPRLRPDQDELGRDAAPRRPSSLEGHAGSSAARPGAERRPSAQPAPPRPAPPPDRSSFVPAVRPEGKAGFGGGSRPWGRHAARRGVVWLCRPGGCVQLPLCRRPAPAVGRAGGGTTALAQPSQRPFHPSLCVDHKRRVRSAAETRTRALGPRRFVLRRSLNRPARPTDLISIVTGRRLARRIAATLRRPQPKPTFLFRYHWSRSFQLSYLCLSRPKARRPIISLHPQL